MNAVDAASTFYNLQRLSVVLWLVAAMFAHQDLEVLRQQDAS